MEIEPFLYGHENSILEYKESFDRNEIAEAIASFSTANGGIILIGVKKDGTPLGINCNEDEIQREVFDIKNNMNDNLPDVKVKFKNHSPSKKIIILQINEGPKKPYGWKGIYYRREGSTNKKLNPTEISELNLQSRGRTFDSLKAKIYERDATIGDLDEEKIKTYVEAFNSSRRNKKMIYTTIGNFLHNSNLALVKGIKNASVLLFGMDPQNAFPNSKINFLLYEGEIEDATQLKYKRLIQGDLISQINEIIELIKVYTENKVVMKGFRRIEINQYPLEAIREAIINAVAHRDYSIFDSFITIRLFDNKLEITSPGGLIEGITLENIKQGGLSKRRNIFICQTLDNIGLMEQSGQGIKNIILALTNAGLKEPLITETNNFFKIEFYSTGLTKSNKTLGITTDLSNKLTYLQKKGLGRIQDSEKKKITIKEYMQMIGTNSRITAKNHLEKFKELNLLKSQKEGKKWIYNITF